MEHRQMSIPTCYTVQGPGLGTGRLICHLLDSIHSFTSYYDMPSTGLGCEAEGKTPSKTVPVFSKFVWMCFKACTYKQLVYKVKSIDCLQEYFKPPAAFFLNQGENKLLQAETIQWENPCLTNSAETICSLSPLLYSKINSRWISELNPKAKTIVFLNTSLTLSRPKFLHRTQKAV